MASMDKKKWPEWVKNGLSWSSLVEFVKMQITDPSPPPPNHILLDPSLECEKQIMFS